MKNTKYLTDEELEKAHTDYSDVMPGGWGDYPWLLKKFIAISYEVVPNTKLLDIGCNSGEMAVMLGKLNDCDVYGFDICEPLVRKAVSKGIKAICGDAKNFPFKSDSFGCVFLGEMIEHTFKPLLILEEIKRVLTKGGVLVGTTVDEDDLIERYPNAGVWSDERLHAYSYGVSSMKSLISKLFVNVRVYDVFTPASIGNRIISWIIFRGEKDA
jgi:SAM-dependent methyltransferase